MSKSVRAMPYTRRVVDAELDELIGDGAVAVALEGAKAVGKSATAAERAAVALLLEDSVTRQLLEAKPSRVVTAQAVLNDAWQHLPDTWEGVGHGRAARG